jgi:DNA mismatch repair protein MutH
MIAPRSHRPPTDETELRARAWSLRGVSLDELAERLAPPPPGPHRGPPTQHESANENENENENEDGPGLATGNRLHTKGKAGELLEAALGASGGSAAVHDFPGLGVELKTIPVDARGAPTESTFVCAFQVAEADTADWTTSWARKKLSRVLWIPLVEGADGIRRIGEPLFWRPTPAQETILQRDFDEVMGRIGAGDVESVTAHLGRWLQVRPKAATGRTRTTAYDQDGERIATIPRGFYLRARFTGALLHDPQTTAP